MEKLNNEQKALVYAVRKHITVMNDSITRNYNNLVESLGDDLSEDLEEWLYDYIMNPSFNPDLAEEKLFGHTPKIGERYQLTVGSCTFKGHVYIVCRQSFEDSPGNYFYH